MVLQAITGLMNSGKTLYLSRLLFKDYLNGKTILSNFRLSFPHKLINQDWLTSLASKSTSEQFILKNTTLGFDELWLWMDSRKAMSKNSMLASYFFLQSQKTDSNIFITAQDNRQNDIRLRENLHRITYCTRVVREKEGFKEINSDKRFLPESMQDKLYIKCLEFKKLSNGLLSQMMPVGIRYIKAKPLFKLYDTTQRIFAVK